MVCSMDDGWPAGHTIGDASGVRFAPVSREILGFLAFTPMTPTLQYNFNSVTPSLLPLLLPLLAMKVFQSQSSNEHITRHNAKHRLLPRLRQLETSFTSLIVTLRVLLMIQSAHYNNRN